MTIKALLRQAISLVKEELLHRDRIRADDEKADLYWAERKRLSNGTEGIEQVAEKLFRLSLDPENRATIDETLLAIPPYARFSLDRLVGALQRSALSRSGDFRMNFARSFEGANL